MPPTRRYGRAAIVHTRNLKQLSDAVLQTLISSALVSYSARCISTYTACVAKRRFGSAFGVTEL
jgi:hypothetical protein